MSNNSQGNTLRLQSPAKVNLYLRVLNQRSDGYHNLHSLFQMVGLYDQLRFREIPEVIRLKIENSTLADDASNLVSQAATLLQKEMLAAGLPQKGAEIILTKNIPESAGLGGGSSDAAATLMGLNRLWSLDWPLDRLATLGARLGSDVPFFFYGPTAWVSGRGTQVETINPCLSGWMVLLHPEISVSTASVYAEYNKKIGKKIRLTKAQQPPKITTLDQKWPSLAALIQAPCNDLEQVTLDAYPQLIGLKAKLKALGGEGVMMSGSGPSIFGLFRDHHKAKAAAENIEKTEAIKTTIAEILTQSPF